MHLQQLLDTEDEQIQKLNTIVVKSIEEEKLLSDKLLEFEDANPSFSSKVADRIAVFGGSWRFITAFVLFMVVWMLANVYLFQRAFDPYPFILLNLILSTLAAIQAPVIMMSQNRQDKKDRLRGELDYDVNRRAHSEIQGLAHKLNLLGDRLGDVEELLRERQ